MAEYEESPASTSAPSGYLTKAAILAVNDSKFEDVYVDEWGGKVRVKALTGRERDRFESSIQANKTSDKQLNLANFRSKLVVLACVDENGHRVFGETDIMQLGEKSAAALQKVFDVASRLAGMSKEDVDTLTGNSETESGGSATGSL